MTSQAPASPPPAADTAQTGQPSAAEALAEMIGILRPAAIRAAATLKVADRIAAGLTGVADLAIDVDAHPDALGRLLRYLASVGLFTRTTTDGDDDVYGLTEMGELLRSDHPLGMSAFLDSDGVLGRGELGLINVLHTVRTGTACHAGVFGVDFWSDVQHDPTYLDSLDKQMGTGIAWDAQNIVDDYPWAEVTHVTDVGGNNGSLLIELLTRHEHLNGRVVDLPNSVIIARKRLAEAGLADRAEAVVASYFDELPRGSDVYLLSAILADWTDDQAVTILRRVATAAGPGGRVLLAEVNLHPTGETASDLMSTGADLYIAATITTPVRTVDELLALAATAGLQPHWRGTETEVRSLLGFRVVAA